MKRILSTILLITIAAITVTTASADSFKTTRDPIRYSDFHTDGDKIELRGRYQSDFVASIAVFSFDDNAVPLTNHGDTTIHSETDGSFTAEFVGSPDEVGAYRIRIILQKGGSFTYRVYYDNGWNFTSELSGDSKSRAERFDFVTENVTKVDSSATALYLSGNDASREKNTQTLEDIKKIADEMTASLDNDYDKAKIISAWVAANVYYNRDISTTADNTDTLTQTIALSNVLNTKRTICSGYANLTAAMLESQGIRAITVIGNAVNIAEYDMIGDASRHHEWTAFWYEKEQRWVMLDSGWDSWNYHENGRDVRQNAPRKYFDITPQALAQTHTPIKAEERVYFALLNESDTDNTAPDITDDPFAMYQPPANNQNPETPEPTPTEDLTVLYIIVGALSVAVIISAVVLVSIRSKNKKQ
ncbi:MAG: transglutaminase-like domain-containing protein [Oscillospiraceae bacterium]|nr:transglutaminase-like domain-containing protein [Oscillospiraceae bacterium]